MTDPSSLGRVRSDAAALTPYKLLAFLYLPLLPFLYPLLYPFLILKSIRYHAEANLRLDKVNVAIQTIEEYLKSHMDNVRSSLNSLTKFVPQSALL